VLGALLTARFDDALDLIADLNSRHVGWTTWDDRFGNDSESIRNARDRGTKGDAKLHHVRNAPFPGPTARHRGEPEQAAAAHHADG
jgi:hypothetical protein